MFAKEEWAWGLSRKTITVLSPTPTTFQLDMLLSASRAFRAVSAAAGSPATGILNRVTDQTFASNFNVCPAGCTPGHVFEKETDRDAQRERQRETDREKREREKRDERGERERERESTDSHPCSYITDHSQVTLALLEIKELISAGKMSHEHSNTNLTRSVTLTRPASKYKVHKTPPTARPQNNSSYVISNVKTSKT